MNIPENAGLSDLRRLLAQAENKLAEWSPKLTEYRVAENNAKSEYEYQLAAARVAYQSEKTATMMNAKAAIDPEVRMKQLAWKAEEAKLILAEDTVKQLQSQRDTLKCMIKSEQISY